MDIIPIKISLDTLQVKLTDDKSIFITGIRSRQDFPKDEEPG